MSVKNRYLKIIEKISGDIYLARQNKLLRKRGRNDRKKRVDDRFIKIGKFIYLKYANTKNSENYKPTKDYLIVMVATSLIISCVVFGFKHYQYSILLGASIAVTIALTQYYLKWFYEMKKRYR